MMVLNLALAREAESRKYDDFKYRSICGLRIRIKTWSRSYDDTCPHLCDLISTSDKELCRHRDGTWVSIMMLYTATCCTPSQEKAVKTSP
jgi:hypothetical protein